MRRDTAERLVRLYLAQAREQTEVLAELQATATPEDLLAARTMIGSVMGEAWLAVLQPLLRDWPDLRPTWLDA